MRFSFVILLLAGVAMALEITLVTDVDFFKLDATPTDQVAFYGGQLDVLFPSPGNIRMGFGLGAHYASVASSFLGKVFNWSFEAYAVADHVSGLSKGMDLRIVSRGGLVMPEWDFSKMGYFTEIDVVLTYAFSKGYFLFFGSGLKSYGFKDSYATFFPIKIGVGGEL